MAYQITFPADARFAFPVTLTAPEGWEPAGYHVTTCPQCGEVTEPYSTYDPRPVHRATGWEMCSPSAQVRARAASGEVTWCDCGDQPRHTTRVHPAA